MAYIEGEPRTAAQDLQAQQEPCIFCRFPKQEPEQDRANLILERHGSVFVIMNRYPYSNGHLMVVPYSHLDAIEKLQKAVREELFEVVAELAARIKQVLSAEGLNIGMNLGKCAGAGIAEHLHVHLVPRWSGDTNFMPVLDETRVISEHLERTYEKLLRRGT
jgi:ATP adenylyltransferase